jgi:hypothetical protein
MRLVEFVKRPGPSLFHRFGMVDDQVAIRVSIFASSPSRDSASEAPGCPRWTKVGSASVSEARSLSTVDKRSGEGER